MGYFRRLSTRELLFKINERTIHMSKEIDDLNASVAAIKTAVADASAGIQDLAAKLAAQSSTNPADVEAAANQLTAIAKGLESVVAAAGEPVSQVAQPEPDQGPPAAETTQGASTGTDSVAGGQGNDTLTA